MRNDNGTFRKRLTTILGITILLLSLAMAITTSWFFLIRLDAVVVDQGTVLTERLAESAIVPLLVNDPKIAMREVENMKRYPGVRYVEIVDMNWRIISVAGENVRWNLAQRMPDIEDGGNIVFEDKQLWHFVAPVLTRPTTSAAELDPTATRPQQERLGYLHLAIEKQPIRQLWGTVVWTNVFWIVLAGLLIALWLASRVRHLTTPLSRLAEIMQQSLEQRAAIEAPLEGAKEVRDIAKVFNSLMDDRDRYAQRLESEVESQTKQLQEAYERVVASEAYQRDFTANITHEMKSPLNAIAVYAQHTLEQLPFIDDKELAERLREFQNIVIDKAGDLKLEIDEILEQTRLEQGKTIVNLEEVQLEDLEGYVRTELGAIAEYNHNELEIRCTGTPSVAIDRELLQRIVRNIAHNACKFTKNGEVELTLHATGKELQIRCCDNGIGIPEAWQTRVFEKYQQVDMSRSREFPGTGLGLTITAGYTKLLGGVVQLDSKEGQGTNVLVTIPLPIRTPTTSDGPEPSKAGTNLKQVRTL